MFHIKDDKRSQKSAELIAGGLKKCLEKKKFDDVTITDIQKASSVGRATFYRLFDRTEDVLAYSCDIGVRKMLDDMRKSGCSSMRDMHKYLLKYSDLYELVMVSRHEHILYNCIYNYRNEIIEILKIHQNDNDNVYFTSILTGIAISVLGVWINNGRKETADDLDRYIRAAFKQIMDM
ncbi:MAG: hypothetical protein NC395_08190 [Prevotella sp.]|nr:hypothetical protein [Prevotella sp.]